MGFASMQSVLLFLCCLQCCCLLSTSGRAEALSLYKVYSYDDQSLEESMQTPPETWSDDAQIVKRKPNNYKFFLKGLRGKRSAPIASINAIHPEQPSKIPCNIYKLISCY